MSEELQTKEPAARPLEVVLKEVEQAIANERNAQKAQPLNIKDLRWQFDQVSARMNQAIYNDQIEQVHESCLKTIAVLVEILARS